MKKLSILGLVFLAGCTPSNIKPAAYSGELEECNRTAKSCQESIACENSVRERYGRPLRDATKGCQP